MKQTLVCEHCSVTTEQTKVFKVFVDKRRVADNKEVRLREDKKRMENEIKKGLYEKRLKELKKEALSEAEGYRLYPGRGLVFCNAYKRTDEELESYLRQTNHDLYWSVYIDDYQLKRQARVETGYEEYYRAFTFGPITSSEHYILCPCCKERNYF